jgi:hypothetical protein
MMTRIFKSRIYYVLGYNNRVKRIPSILLGIRIPPVREDRRELH